MIARQWWEVEGGNVVLKKNHPIPGTESVKNLPEPERPSPAQFDPLKYRGVFDYPHNQSANCLNYGGTDPETSAHVLKFMGWEGRNKHTRFTGKASTKSVLDQKAAWMSQWLQKGQYAGGQQQ
jgi:hypothetical protein